MVGLVLHDALVQERDGATALLKSIRARWPWLRHAFADSGYAGPKPKDALRGVGDWSLEIIKRSDTAKGFEILPRMGRRAHLRMPASGKGLEKSIAYAEAWSSSPR